MHFLKTFNAALSAQGRPLVNGHSFRISGATFYLLTDIHPDFVKVIRRWKSDAFMRYWRQVKVIEARNLTDAAVVDADGALPGRGE
ncbi:hypothetical protein JCM3770_006424 [Rhodotorula araucariae]